MDTIDRRNMGNPFTYFGSRVIDQISNAIDQWIIAEFQIFNLCYS